MTLNVLIVEDDKSNSELLKFLLHKHCSDVNLIGVAYDLKSAVLFLEDHNPHIIFLDIQLGTYETGFDLLDQIGECNSLIVFTTAYDNYAIDAIKENVFDYLLKPLSILELQKTIEKARHKLSIDVYSRLNKFRQIENVSQMNSDVIAIPNVNSIEIINKVDICYFHADGKYTDVYLTSNKVVTSSRNIKEYELLLKYDCFIRVHHSYLININKILKIEKGIGWHCIMINKVSIPVSRRKKDDLYRALNL